MTHGLSLAQSRHYDALGSTTLLQNSSRHALALEVHPLPQIYVPPQKGFKRHARQPTRPPPPPLPCIVGPPRKPFRSHIITRAPFESHSITRAPFKSHSISRARSTRTVSTSLPDSSTTTTVAETNRTPSRNHKRNGCWPLSEGHSVSDTHQNLYRSGL